MRSDTETIKAEEDLSLSSIEPDSETNSIFDDLVRDLALGWQKSSPGSAVFLIGAGCSASAGIPLARDIAKSAALLLFQQYKRETTSDPDTALEWLTGQGILGRELDWSNSYYSLFNEVSRNKGLELQLIRDAISGSAGKTNWSHICLGELVAKHFVHTVLTTNFDQLVLEGIVRTGILPVVADGIEALDRISSRPDHPQVIHLHGSRHSYRIRNSVAAVGEPFSHFPTISTMYGLLHDSSVLIVVGYSGGEEGIMHLLIEAATHLPDKRVYWIAHSSDMGSLSGGFQQLRAATKSLHVLLNQDSDAFFKKLTARLGIGAPEWMQEPLQSFSKQLRQIADGGDQTINAEIDSRCTEALYLDEQLVIYRKEKADLLAIRDRARLTELSGNLSEALPLLQEIARCQPSYANWRHLADAAYEVGKAGGNIRVLNSALEAIEEAIHYVTNEGSKESSSTFWTRGLIIEKILDEDFSDPLFARGQESFERALKDDSCENREHRAELLFDYAKLWSAAADKLRNDIEKREAMLQQAIELLKTASSLRKEDNTSLVWGWIENNLGSALSSMGRLKVDIRFLIEAKTAYERSLALKRFEENPGSWAISKVNLARTLKTIGKHEKDKETLEMAIEHAAEAIEKLQSGDSERREGKRVQRHLVRAERVIKEAERQLEVL